MEFRAGHPGGLNLHIEVRQAGCGRCCNPALLPDGYRVPPAILCWGGATLAGRMDQEAVVEWHLYTLQESPDTGGRGGAD